MRTMSARSSSRASRIIASLDDDARVGRGHALGAVLVLAHGEVRVDGAALGELDEVMADRGEGLDQALVVVAREEEVRRVARGGHRGGRGLVREEGHLAEDVAGAQAREGELAAAA